MEDCKSILSYNGYSIGYNGTIDLNLIKQDMTNKFKNELKEAKCIYISLCINKEQSLFDISDVVESISDVLDKNIKVIINTSCDNNIPIDECNYQLLIAGLHKMKYND